MDMHRVQHGPRMRAVAHTSISISISPSFPLTLSLSYSHTHTQSFYLTLFRSYSLTQSDYRSLSLITSHTNNHSLHSSSHVGVHRVEHGPRTRATPTSARLSSIRQRKCVCVFVCARQASALHHANAPCTRIEREIVCVRV